MIRGAHVLVYSKDAERTRAFFRDTIGWPHVDAGEGWLVFRLPPAELGVHPEMPGDDCGTELSLMCDDIGKTMADLAKKGVQFSGPVEDRRYGLVTSIRLPDGGSIGLYEPRHPTAIAFRRGGRRKATRRPARQARSRKPARRARVSARSRR